MKFFFLCVVVLQIGQHEHPDHQYGEKGAQHRLAPAQVITRQHDRQIIKIQESDFRINEIVDQQNADQNGENKMALKMVENVPLELFHQAIDLPR